MTNTGLTKIKEGIAGLVQHCAYKKDGVEQTVAVYQTSVEGNVIRVRFYFDDTISGQLTDFRLIDVDGDVMDSKVDLIDKAPTGGVIIAFEYGLTEV